jgi:hypothetical protein
MAVSGGQVINTGVTVGSVPVDVAISDISPSPADTVMLYDANEQPPEEP